MRRGRALDGVAARRQQSRSAANGTPSDIEVFVHITGGALRNRWCAPCLFSGTRTMGPPAWCSATATTPWSCSRQATSRSSSPRPCPDMDAIRIRHCRLRVRATWRLELGRGSAPARGPGDTAPSRLARAGAGRSSSPTVRRISRFSNCACAYRFECRSCTTGRLTTKSRAETQRPVLSRSAPG